MTVFKTALKILNKCKVPIIMYTVFLIAFSSLSYRTADNSTSFVASKPDVLIINNDEKVGITENLIDYISKTAYIKDIKNDADAINDALFYREVSYIIYIPTSFRDDFLNGLNPKIEIKSTGDYEASVADLKLSRYLSLAQLYQNSFTEEELIKKINSTLEVEPTIEVTSSLDTNKLSKATSFYNFANYSILAGSVYAICLILSSFKTEKINKRTVISSMNINHHNRLLLISTGLFALILWLIYVIISIFLIGNTMFTLHGLLYILNSLVFTICALTIAFIIGNLVMDKNAINGIINVIALGSSFLCGAFVPMEFLPKSVIDIAHILPSYWYIKSNELIKNIEIINIESLKPLILNSIVILLFALLFIIIANMISKKKRKID